MLVSLLISYIVFFDSGMFPYNTLKPSFNNRSIISSRFF